MKPRKPVNPSAYPEAVELLARLYSISGKCTLSGQHNPPCKLSRHTEQAVALTGQTPAIWGQDFGFSADQLDSVEMRPEVMRQAIARHEAGQVVTLMWHAVRPTEEEPGTFKEQVCCGPLSDAEWTALLTPGSEVRLRWERQVDVVAGFLTQLREARVPVLWRPYHEMNGDWFWWGARPGPQGYAALWRLLFDRLTNLHGLNNLIWVWNANAPRVNAAPYAGFYPGHDVVDVLAADVYAADYAQSHHDDLLSLAEGRPIALGEVGDVPPPDLFDAQPNWAWFMVWSSYITVNDPDAVRALYACPRVLTAERLSGAF